MLLSLFLFLPWCVVAEEEDEEEEEEEDDEEVGRGLLLAERSAVCACVPTTSTRCRFAPPDDASISSRKRMSLIKWPVSICLSDTYATRSR